MQKYKLLTFVVLVLVMSVFFVREIYQFYNDPFIGADEVVFEVEPGLHLKGLAKKLEQAHQLKSAYFFVLIAQFLNRADRIQAGEYLVKPEQTVLDVLHQLNNGLVRQYPIRFIEGWSIHDVLAELNRSPAWKNTQLPSEKEILHTLNIPHPTIEGLLFPDTYYVHKGMNPITVIKQAHEKLMSLLSALWQTRAVGLPLKSPYEALILASIVEKEAAIDAERKQIAGVFIRRLKINMRLDSDPTVIYGLGPDFTGRLLRKHLQKQTPYNTYMNKGLPPSPIAMVSQKSLEAVVSPEPGDALYFVAKGNGEHVFSSSLEAHNQAVSEYRKQNK